MKEITKLTVAAFMQNKSFSLSNSVVIIDKIETKYYLFGNLIATYDKLFKILTITNAGYKTNTTKERLNGILSAYKLGYIYQKKYVWYYVDNYGFETEFTGRKVFNL